MIQITQGIFGHLVNGHVVPVTPKDGPISLTKQLEARLVDRGVAKYVGDTGDEQAAVEAATTVPPSDGLPSYSKAMKLEELKAIANLYGVDDVDIAAAKNKDALIALIDEAASKSEDEDEPDPGNGDDAEQEEEPGGAPPDLSAEEPVQ